MDDHGAEHYRPTPYAQFGPCILVTRAVTTRYPDKKSKGGQAGRIYTLVYRLEHEFSVTSARLL